MLFFLLLLFPYFAAESKPTKQKPWCLTTFFRKTRNVEVLRILKKIHAAREFSIRATMKRTLYRQGKTTAVMLVSRTHLKEVVLDRVLFIL